MLDPDQALEILKEGNRKFLQDTPPDHGATIDRQRRLETAREQQPFAILVSCSDSRVSPELLFGRGLGELYIVRNAGNTVDKVALGSIEYAVHVLGVRLIVVLGHQRCGAVQAAIESMQGNASLPGNLGHMIRPIIPAVREARNTCPRPHQADNLWEAAVRQNIKRVVTNLHQSEPIISEAVRSKHLRIIGAYYCLDNGRVEFLTD